ncbi:MAG: hypothetical protein ABIT69_09180 [Sphingomicrobium sp.]
MSVTYGRFREDMLCALYQEQIHNGVDELISFQELAADHDIEWRSGWLLDLQKSLIGEGFLRGPQNSQNDDMAIGKLLGYGLEYIEKKYGTLDGVPTMISKRGDVLVNLDPKTDGAFDPDIFDPETFDTGSPIDSATWTGLPRTGVLSPEATESLMIALKVADDALAKSGASNEEAAQARAYIMAIHSLAEAPSPPADIIWELVMRLGAIAGLAQLFVALIGLYK